jgi:hypothetical protein
MAVHKIIPAALNKDGDFRTISNTEMTDALNVTISPDSNGNSFVLKNSRGNVVLENPRGTYTNPGSTRTVIGSVTDYDQDYIYFFVHGTNQNHGIYRCNFNTDSPFYEIVLERAELNFVADSHIDADVVRYDVNQNGSVETIIYFTDGKSEPKKINVDRAMSGSAFTDYATSDYAEFLSVCKTPPISSIAATVNTDTAFKQNYIYGRCFSFGCRYVYKDGEVSVLSPLSEVIVNRYLCNAYFGSAAVLDNGIYVSIENYVSITVPSWGKEVSKIELVFRDNQTGAYHLIDSVPVGATKTLNGTQVWDNSTRVYKFYNDQTYPIVPFVEALKGFDSVPRTALTQSFVNGRLVYGNYSENFPEVSGNATFTVSYPSWTNSNSNTEVSTSSGIKTWKNGVSHNFGVVFYDDRGRHSFVKELGSVYVKNMGERTSQGENKGRAEITANLSGINMPSWAKYYSLVYGGNNQIEDFMQYYVADGFQSWYYSADYTQTYDPTNQNQGTGFTSTEDWNNKVFVSLKNWVSELGYTGRGGVDYAYKFRKGDVLRVVRYSASGSSPDAYTYPEALEYKILDMVFLTEDVKDQTAESTERIRQAQQANATARDNFIQNIFSDIITTPTEAAEQELQNAINDHSQNIARIIQEEGVLPQHMHMRFSGRNPIFNGNYAPCKGWFLVLEPSSSSVATADGGTSWNPLTTPLHVSPGETTSNNHTVSTPHFHPLDNWGKHVLVEIYTPNKIIRQSKVYKEINIVGTANSGAALPSNLNISGGDVWWKGTPLLKCGIDTSQFKPRNLTAYTYHTRFIESRNASHYYSSRADSFGKTFFVNRYLPSGNRGNDRRFSLTYSDEFFSDSTRLSLSSFTTSLANYKDFPSEYGQIDRVINSGDNLYVLQDAKVSRVSVGKVALQLADGTSNLIASNEVFSEPYFYPGSFGSSGMIGAVVERDGNIYFLDITSKKVFRVNAGELTDLSAKNMSSFFYGKIEAIKKCYDGSGGQGNSPVFPRIIGGWDPDYDEYLLTVGDGSYYSARSGGMQNLPGFTIAYSGVLEAWTTRYSFIPTCYGSVGDVLVSCKYSYSQGNDFKLFYHHGGFGSLQANYYGTQHESILEVVSSLSPSENKVYTSLSIEGNYSGWTAYAYTSNQNSSQFSIAEAREGMYYAQLPKDTSGISTKHKVEIGTLASAPASQVATFNSRVDFAPIPKGAVLMVGTSTTSATFNSFASSKSIGYSGTLSGANTGSRIYASMSKAEYGDFLRDYFCRVILTATTSEPWELFAVNVNQHESNLTLNESNN